MSNFLKKIILVFALTATLWSGIGFSVDLSSQKNIKIAYAQLAETSETTPRNTRSAIGSAIATSFTAGPLLEVIGLIKNGAGGFTNGENLTSGAGWLIDLVLMVVGVLLHTILMPIFGILVRISALFLDVSISMSLDKNMFEAVDMGIMQVWSLIRNIFNITFLFFLLYAAIKMIIWGADAKVKEIVKNVIIAALLINFSLFLTRLIVDISNIFAVALYNMATNGEKISDIISQTLGLGYVFASTGVSCIFCVPFFVASAIQLFVVIAATGLFLYMTALFFIRNVVLIFLMVTSPVGFLGDLIPLISDYSKKWKATLFGQAMISPVFLLFFLLITKISESLNSEALNRMNFVMGTETANFTNTAKFALLFCLFIAATKMTREYAGALGPIIEKAAGLGVTAALALATGGTALVGRQVVGRIAAGTLKKYGAKMGKAAITGNIAQRGLAKAGLWATDKAAKGTWDIRNTKSFGQVINQANKFSAVKFNAGRASGTYGKSGKLTGYAGQQKAEEERMNEAYLEAQKSVSASDIVAARAAKAKRDARVEVKLASNNNYTNAKNNSERYRNDGLDQNDELKQAKRFKESAETEFEEAKRAREAAEMTNDAARIAEAKRAENVAEREKAKMEKEYETLHKELIKKNEEKYKAELEVEEKIMKREKRVAELEVEKTLTPDEQQKIYKAEKAKYVAQAVREGQHNLFSFIRTKGRKKRSEELAEKMESNKEKNDAQKLGEQISELQKELKEAKKQS